MKRFFASASAAALIVTALSGSARANADYVPVVDDHPVRVAAYPLHIVGTAIQWVINRPIHYVMSLPYMSDISGHKINETLSEPGNSSAL